MARILITGSVGGLGLAAAQALIADGHDVFGHARSAQRAADLEAVGHRMAGVVVGDLSTRAGVESVAAQANEAGRMDAVIHNAGIYLDPDRIATPEGHCRVFATNVLAPYLLTALMHRPERLIYISSDMAAQGVESLADIDWTQRRWDGVQAYCDSKLQVAALALGVARRWPSVYGNAVDPGWVPTRMGGPEASDDLSLGHVTQAWLAGGTGEDVRISGKFLYHQAVVPTAAAVSDAEFQDALLTELETLTGVGLAP